MTKLRKQRRKKQYRANVNRKRLRNKLSHTGSVKCDEIKDAWIDRRSAKQNLRDFGLVYDPNENLKGSNVKRELASKLAATSSWKTEMLVKRPEVWVASKGHIAVKLEEEANAPRDRMFKLPVGQVEWISYLMDKYGADYKLMARDKRNYYQETWKQIRAKIRVFIGVPEQFEKYVKEQNKDLEATVKLYVDDDSDLEF